MEQPWLFQNLNAKIVVKVLADTIKKFDQCGVNTMTIFLNNKVVVPCEQSENIEQFRVNKVLSQIFKLVENLSGALWRKPQWHNKN